MQYNYSRADHDNTSDQTDDNKLTTSFKPKIDWQSVSQQ